LKVLIDTQVLLWLALEPRRLRANVIALVTGNGVERVFSAVAAWEMSIKWRLGRLPLPQHLKLWVDRLSRELVTEPLPVRHDHVVRVADLPNHHRDPFDRLLAAQSQVEAIPLVTADPIFDSYEIDVISAM
jgi:PIN domain nuclease of toxin-antitoxin system